MVRQIVRGERADWSAPLIFWRIHYTFLYLTRKNMNGNKKIKKKSTQAISYESRTTSGEWWWESRSQGRNERDSSPAKVCWQHFSATLQKEEGHVRHTTRTLLKGVDVVIWQRENENQMTTWPPRLYNQEENTVSKCYHWSRLVIFGFHWCAKVRLNLFSLYFTVAHIHPKVTVYCSKRTLLLCHYFTCKWISCPHHKDSSDMLLTN